MIGRLPTAAAISLLMAICSVCGLISALVTSNMSSSKRKERAIQSKMDSFFGGKNKPQKQAGEKIEL